MKHSKHKIQRFFTVFFLIEFFLLSSNEIQAETLPQKEAEPLISCTFDVSLLKLSSLIKVAISVSGAVILGIWLRL